MAKDTHASKEARLMIDPLTHLSLLTVLLLVLISFLGSTATYLAQGTISWPLVALTGVPELIGVWIGWKIAHALPARPLKIALALTLIGLGPVLSLMR